MATARKQEALIEDVRELASPTVDERGRQRFCSALRRYAIQDMVDYMEHDFRTRVQPGSAAQGFPLHNGPAIGKAMRSENSYRFYSVLRYNAQEMCYMSVQDSVERTLPAMIRVAKEAAERNPAGGSLRLDPPFRAPDYVTELDVHLVPGGFCSEWTADDVAQGAVVGLGSRVFSATMSHRTWGGVAAAVSRWVKHRWPGHKVGRMLDLGTSSGKNLLPHVAAFPGVEAHGVDVGAPLLRWGHAIAEREGVPVHFSQQNAESLDFPDQHFDLIVSSFFFHELPLEATRRVLKECRRLLRPGGLMVQQELPASGLVGPWEDFFWNWDAGSSNNELFYIPFREQNAIDLMEEAGFDRASSFSHILPDAATYPDRFDAFGWDEPGRPRHGKGGWYVFGSRVPD